MKEAPLYNDAMHLARWVATQVPADCPAGAGVTSCQQ
jgi:hypothetical protein